MADRIWTCKDILGWTTGYLERKGDERPRLSAEWLLSDVTGLSRVELYTNYDRPLTPDELAEMRAGIQRRAAGEPLQYVTGETAFRHIVVRCEREVLIPRPETELLVEAVLEHLPTDGPALAVGRSSVSGADDASKQATGSTAASSAPSQAAGADSIATKSGNGMFTPGPTTDRTVSRAAFSSSAIHATPYPAYVLEVGTGTGCIACSLARERAKTHVVATDISQVACALARRNRDALGLAGLVDVVEGDLVSGVDPRLMGHFDVLVSNPPYIPTEVVDELPYEVRGFEPHLALDGGADGLDVYRRLLAVAPQVLRRGGVLAVELFETTLDAAADLARAQGGWASVEVRQDLTHRPRFLVAVREGS